MLNLPTSNMSLSYDNPQDREMAWKNVLTVFTQIAVCINPPELAEYDFQSTVQTNNLSEINFCHQISDKILSWLEKVAPGGKLQLSLIQSFPREKFDNFFAKFHENSEEEQQMVNWARRSVQDQELVTLYLPNLLGKLFDAMRTLVEQAPQANLQERLNFLKNLMRFAPYIIGEPQALRPFFNLIKVLAQPALKLLEIFDPKLKSVIMSLAFSFTRAKLDFKIEKVGEFLHTFSDHENHELNTSRCDQSPKFQLDVARIIYQAVFLDKNLRDEPSKLLDEAIQEFKRITAVQVDYVPNLSNYLENIKCLVGLISANHIADIYFMGISPEILEDLSKLFSFPFLISLTNEDFSKSCLEMIQQISDEIFILISLFTNLEINNLKRELTKLYRTVLLLKTLLSFFAQNLTRRPVERSTPD
ncbi:MAG: hypothetical protein NZO16_01780 [Deltaproteobacteria bacterium]|nr:hypothetical protein [Deltaproteobacteria bacterium]